jgi:hypothetical protein
MGASSFVPVTEPVAALLPVDDRLLAPHPDLYGYDPAARCLALAQALAGSPAWARLRQHARLVVRPSSGLIGIIGEIPEDLAAAAFSLGSQVPGLLRRLRPVSYPEVEQACLDLAAELTERLGAGSLRGYRMTGVPRGGMIVAGMLAYTLGLRSDQLRHLDHADGPTILVDDCALSGLRLRESLARCPSREVVVVLLHAHPDLRRSVESSEPRVLLCLAARDLGDHAPARDDYDAWKRRWQERSPHDYWTGDPDHVCYPWNEPDALIWNEETEQAEAGWRVVPPAWCLKTRAEASIDDLQVCVSVEGALMPAAEVIWARTGEGTVVARLGSEKSLLLRGTAEAMWDAMVEAGDATAAAGRVASRLAMDAEAVSRDLDALVSALVERGLLRVTR